MPTPHMCSSSRGAMKGRSGEMTTRAAVNAIFQSSEALRSHAREELNAAAQERRRIARERIQQLRSNVSKKESDADGLISNFHTQRDECTRIVRSELREFRDNLSSTMSECLSELANTRREGARLLSKSLALAHRENTEACQEQLRTLTAGRRQDMDALRKNLAEFMCALRDDVAASRARRQAELGWSSGVKAERIQVAPRERQERHQGRHERSHGRHERPL
jgi:hypothetical protein